MARNAITCLCVYPLINQPAIHLYLRHTLKTVFFVQRLFVHLRYIEHHFCNSKRQFSQHICHLTILLKHKQTNRHIHERDQIHKWLNGVCALRKLSERNIIIIKCINKCIQVCWIPLCQQNTQYISCWEDNAEKQTWFSHVSALTCWSRITFSTQFELAILKSLDEFGILSLAIVIHFFVFITTKLN